MSRTRVILCFFLFSFFDFNVDGQSFFGISGRVIDSLTGEALPLASIGLKHSSHATISNAEGFFTIRVQQKHLADTLRVAMLGYSVMEIPVSQVSGKEKFDIKLTIAPTYLGELVVTDTMSAKEILKRVYKSIAKNYSFRPYQLAGFYREIQKADEQNISLIESDTLLYSEGFKGHGSDKFKLLQLRKSIGFSNPYVPFWDDHNLLIALLSQNFVKFKNKSLLRFKEAHRKNDTSVDGVPVYVLVLNERPDFWLNTLYIRSDNYAIIRAEENFDSNFDSERKWKVERNPLIIAYPQVKKLQVSFRLFNGKYYPESFYMIFESLYRDSVTGKQVLDFKIDQRFVVTNIVTESLEPIRPEDVLSPEVSLKNIPVKYDPEFWKNYTILTETPLDSITRVELEKQVQLEEQFKKQ